MRNVNELKNEEVWERKFALRGFWASVFGRSPRLGYGYGHNTELRDGVNFFVRYQFATTLSFLHFARYMKKKHNGYFFSHFISVIKLKA